MISQLCVMARKKRPAVAVSITGGRLRKRPACAYVCAGSEQDSVVPLSAESSSTNVQDNNCLGSEIESAVSMPAARGSSGK